MKRTLLALLGVLILSLAGSVSIAQTDYGNSNDPPVADQPGGSSTSDVTGSQSADSPTSPTDQDPNQYQSQDADRNDDPNRNALPATGSTYPFVLLLGLAALGGAAILRVFRLRKVR